MTNKDGIRKLVHTPAEMMSGYLAWAEQATTNPGIKFGVGAIDQKMIPMRPGELVSVMGRPGDGKTSILAYLAKQESDRITQRGATKYEAVVYVTWEQSAEELTAFFMAGDKYSVSDVAWGRVDLDMIRRQVVQGAGVPIWVIGHGITRAGEKVPRMTPDAVLEAIESMQADFGIRPTLILFDYLQLIPIPNARERVQQVTEVPIRIKEVALRLGVPAVAGVQASRDVDNRQEKLAELRDAQWASSIEQTSDKVFSLWRPARTQPLGSFIGSENGHRYEVTDNLLLVRMLKQRGDRGRFTWALYFNPAYLKLAEMETRKADIDYDPYPSD